MSYLCTAYEFKISPAAVNFVTTLTHDRKPALQVIFLVRAIAQRHQERYCLHYAVYIVCEWCSAGILGLGIERTDALSLSTFVKDNCEGPPNRL